MNKRHIVRALGNIGDQSVGRHLLQLLDYEHGLILGDIAEALGKLQSIASKEQLQGLAEHHLPWVVQKARWALKKLRV